MPTKSTAKRGRGRPPHVATATLKAKVSVAAGGGMRHEDIALALDISDETLRKYYSRELSIGAQLRRVEALVGLQKAAKRGVPSAVKAYLAIEPQLAARPLGPGETAAAPPPAPLQTPVEAPAPKAVPLGKKDQAQADAATAAVGTHWKDLLAPSSIQ